MVWGTAAALALVVGANRSARREAWFVGGAILSLVAIKLFTVDLSSVGTAARIIPFLAVGSLMLLIGHLAPLPARFPEAGVRPNTNQAGRK